MWGVNQYILALILTTLVFYFFRKRIVSFLKKAGSLLELYAIVLALIFFIFPMWSAETEFRNSLLTYNCMNDRKAATLFSLAEGKEWISNQRYSTDFYKTNWADVMHGLPPEDKQAYAALIDDMDISNVILERLELTNNLFASAGRDSVIKTEAIKANTELSKLGKDIISKFSQLGVNLNSCLSTGYSYIKRGTPELLFYYNPIWSPGSQSQHGFIF